MQKTILFFFMIALPGWLGCDVAFNPKDDYADKLVVYSILDPTKRTQFARVYLTYNVAGTNPLVNVADKQVQNASVRVIDDRGQAYLFRDSLVKRESSDRYTSDIIAYYSDQLTPSPGKRYKLEVSAPGFERSVTEVTVPEPYLIFVNGRRSTIPLLADSGNVCNCFHVSVFGGNGAKGQLTRFFLDYTVKKPGEPKIKFRREVPVSLRRLSDGRVVPVYPQPDRATFLEFPHQLFFNTLSEILSSEPSAQIDVTEATFMSYAMDPALYNYYLIAHGFGDPFSVRLDQPDFTNIQNGLGVFGALAVDSLTVPIR